MSIVKALDENKTPILPSLHQTAIHILMNFLIAFIPISH